MIVLVRGKRIIPLKTGSQRGALARNWRAVLAYGRLSLWIV
jgi:hypothetical protein